MEIVQNVGWPARIISEIILRSVIWHAANRNKSQEALKSCSYINFPQSKDE